MIEKTNWQTQATRAYYDQYMCLLLKHVVTNAAAHCRSLRLKHVRYHYDSVRSLLLEAQFSVSLSFILSAALVLSGCVGRTDVVPPGAVVGRPELYDYSPSIIQVGHLRTFWWCGRAHNPNVPSQYTDAILEESVDLETGTRSGPQVVLAETPGAWDSAYTCNPQVVQGTFLNPLGDGSTYTYAMYYVGTRQQVNTNNSIGVAFSVDGVHWKKYPDPVIASLYTQGYGPAQPVPYNSDGKQAVWLFYENDDPPLLPNHHTQAISSDGVHFKYFGTITTKGLQIPPNLASWGDMAYDSIDGYWYATFNLPSRALSTTANVFERGSIGVQLYKIPKDDLLIGQVGWQLLKTLDTNLTGLESIFIAGLLREPHGNLLLGDGGKVELFPSFSNKQISWYDSPGRAAAAGDVSLWDIGRYTWSPAEPPTYPLRRYRNSHVHVVTTGWIDRQGDFSEEKTLGQLYQYPTNRATTALYGCKTGAVDSFLSIDGGCEGAHVMGLIGFLYTSPIALLDLVPLYRCKGFNDHFASNDPHCEGSVTERLLGYIPPA